MPVHLAILARIDACYKRSSFIFNCRCSCNRACTGCGRCELYNSLVLFALTFIFVALRTCFAPGECSQYCKQLLVLCALTLYMIAQQTVSILLLFVRQSVRQPLQGSLLTRVAIRYCTFTCLSFLGTALHVPKFPRRVCTVCVHLL